MPRKGGGVIVRTRIRDIWNRISLRNKLTGLTVLLLVLGLLASGFGVLTMLRTYLINDADRQLQRVLTGITSQTVGNDERGNATQFVLARFDGGRLLDANQAWRQIAPDIAPADIAKALDNSNVGVTSRNAQGVIQLRLAAKPLNDGSIAVLGLPFDNSNRLINQLFTLFFVFGFLVIVIGTVLTRLLIDSTFAPLRQVERTAAAIASGDFGQRLGYDSPNTEVGRLNRSLNRMLNRIDTALADRARTIDQQRRFISDASHELRTPLVSLRGYAELYRMGAIQSREDVTHAMDRIEREAIRLGTLVSDLLALARLDEAREMTMTPVDLVPLAHDAVFDARAQAPDRNIQFLPAPPRPASAIAVRVSDDTDDTNASLTTSTRRLRLAGRRQRREQLSTAVTTPTAPENATEPIIMGSEDKIRQLLTNIVGNAIRYTPDGSPLEIAAYTDEIRHMAVLEVIDHGEGIPAQVRDKIFERFWRADSSRTRDTGGSGLGLAIVSSIVSAHQGRIGITETVAGGATFRVEFPLASATEPAEDAAAD